MFHRNSTRRCAPRNTQISLLIFSQKPTAMHVIFYTHYLFCLLLQPFARVSRRAFGAGFHTSVSGIDSKLWIQAGICARRQGLDAVGRSRRDLFGSGFARLIYLSCSLRQWVMQTTAISHISGSLSPILTPSALASTTKVQVASAVRVHSFRATPESQICEPLAQFQICQKPTSPWDPAQASNFLMLRRRIGRKNIQGIKKVHWCEFMEAELSLSVSSGEIDKKTHMVVPLDLRPLSAFHRGGSVIAEAALWYKVSSHATYLTSLRLAA